MACKHGSSTLIENNQDLPAELQAAMQLIGDGSELIPVQLPEGPTEPQTHSPEASSLSRYPTAAISTESISPTGPRRAHPGSPLETSRQPSVPLESSSSPRSDFSRNSEESVIIVGDTFSAPINLQFSVDNSPHVRDAGGFDRYSRSINQPLSMSVSWRRDDPSPSLSSTPPTNPRRPLPSPPPLPELGSPFALHSPKTCASYTELPSISSITRPRASPTGPRPFEKPGDSGAKASRWRKKKKREEMESLMGAGSGGVGQSSPRFRAQASQEWDRRQSTPQLLPDQGLNPFATSFRPTANSKERAHSLPNVTTSEQPTEVPQNFQRQYASNTYPLHPVHSANLGFIQSETLTNIEQDLHHLRQWSSLFQLQSFAFPEYQNHSQNPQLQPSLQQYQHHHLLRQQHRHQTSLYQQQNQHQPYYHNHVGPIMVAPPRKGFGTFHAIPSVAQAVPRLALHGADPNLQSYHVRGTQNPADDSRRSSLIQLQLGGHSGSSESSTSTPISATVELSLDFLDQALTEIQLPETHIPISIHHSPAVQGGELIGGSTSSGLDLADTYVDYATGLALPGNKVGPRLRAQSYGGKSTSSQSTPFKDPARTLTARGKSSLTPVTERSEISTPNASISSASQLNKRARRHRRQKKPKENAVAAADKSASEKPKKA